MRVLTSRGYVEIVRVSLADARDADALQLEVARTIEATRQGLMHRERMPWNAGMWLVWPVRGERAIWNANVLFPIDVIWLDGARVVAIHHQIHAQSRTTHGSFVPVTSAIEVNAGWAAARHVVIGDTVEVQPH